MSIPQDASTTRQRNPRLEHESDNPASLSADPTKKVERNKPVVKPPFQDLSMNRFLVYLLLGVLTIVAFYIWRITVWASDSGGYWKLITGAGAAASAASGAASLATSAVASSSTGRAVPHGAIPTKAANNVPKQDVQSQIFALAEALGVAPADLSNAIRPLTDPTVPNPVEEKKKLEKKLEQVEAGGGAAEKEPTVLGLMGEAFLD